MAQGWWDKALRFVGFGPEEDEMDAEEVAATAEDVSDTRRHARNRPPAAPAPNVVNLASRQGPTPSQPVKILVVEPRAFDDVQAIVDQLKGRRPIILNLENVDKEMAQRILNFLHGAIYALGGETQKISTGIFFFAPPGIDVANLGRGLSGAALGGAAFDPTDLVEALSRGGMVSESLSRAPLADGRGGLFLPAQEPTPRPVERDRERDPLRPDWRSR